MAIITSAVLATASTVYGISEQSRQQGEANALSAAAETDEINQQLLAVMFAPQEQASPIPPQGCTGGHPDAAAYGYDQPS